MTLLQQLFAGECQVESPPATELLKQLPNTPGSEREQKILAFARAGYIPSFLRRWCPIPVSIGTHQGVFYVLPDFFSLGTDQDFVRVRVNPVTAELIARELEGSLPTITMVAATYQACGQKLVAQPWGPPYDSSMLLTSRWKVQDNKIEKGMNDHGFYNGALVEGHLKNIVIGRGLVNTEGAKVGIFGWYDAAGKAIQGPTANWRDHEWTYADYSHGMRVVSGVMDVDGGKLSVVEVLQRTELAELISAEGTLAHCSYLDFHAQALQS